MKLLRRTLLFAACLVTLGAGLASGPANAAPVWAPEATATVQPGVQTFTEGSGQCTANFVFFDAADVYIGQAAHCAGTGGNTETNGCEAGTLPLGTPVEVDGASRPGVIAYSSWVTMQGNGESDTDTCFGNDFALVRLDPADHGRVNPTIPYWGGPVGLGNGSSFLEKVYSYGNSGLRLGLSPLSPKEGYSLGVQPSGWSHDVYTITPGIPGDSGSAFIDSNGNALGVLSTLSAAPFPASNQVSDLRKALDYMRAHTGLDAVQLALGTSGFSPGLLP